MYGISAFARDVVAFADNMQRALQAVDEGARDTADSTLKALLDGLDLTERGLMNALEKHGVKKLEPRGQKFDPNRHQAMYEIEDASVPSGSIVQVMQAGYVIGERVLRPALVAVASMCSIIRLPPLGPRQPRSYRGEAEPSRSFVSKHVLRDAVSTGSTASQDERQRREERALPRHRPVVE